MLITKFDDVQNTEGYIDQWNKHLVLAMKHLFKFEYRLCNDIFKKIGSNVEMAYFSKIASQSGIFIFSNLRPIKFLKLLDMFGSLNNLKLDFNRLFGVEDCIEIQNQQGISSKGKAKFLLL